jgi:hypothetical protein
MKRFLFLALAGFSLSTLADRIEYSEVMIDGDIESITGNINCQADDNRCVPYVLVNFEDNRRDDVLIRLGAHYGSSGRARGTAQNLVRDLMRILSSIRDDSPMLLPADFDTNSRNHQQWAPARLCGRPNLTVIQPDIGQRDETWHQEIVDGEMSIPQTAIDERWRQLRNYPDYPFVNWEAAECAPPQSRPRRGSSRRGRR